MKKLFSPIRTLLLLCFSLFGFLSVAHADGDDVAIVNITASPEPSYPVSTTFKIRLSATVDNEPKASDECGTGQPRGWSPDSAQWSWPNPPGATIEGTGSSVYLVLSFGAVGPKSVNVTANVKYTSNCGTRSGRKTQAVNGFQIVGIGNLQWKRNGTYVSSDISDLLQGSTISFKATANPVGAPWPSGYPKWSGSVTPSTGDTKDAPFSSPYGAGSRTVTVSCGNPVTINVAVVLNPVFNHTLASASKVSPAPATPRATVGTNFGVTFAEFYKGMNEPLNVGIGAYQDGNKWYAIMTSLHGYYNQLYSNQGRTELFTSGVTAATTAANSCNQIKDLQPPTRTYSQWVVRAAIVEHENVHATHFTPAIQDSAGAIEGIIEGNSISVPNTGQSKAQAILDLKALAGWSSALGSSFNLYETRFGTLWPPDHGTPDGTGPAYQAEDPSNQTVINNILQWRAGQHLGACPT